MQLKRSLTVVCVFFLLLIVGCSNNIMQETEGKEKEFPPSMPGFIHVNGKDYQMEEGDYQWQRKKGLETEMVMTDHASPYQMAEHINPVFLKPSQIVDIKIEEDPTIKVYLWNEIGRDSEIKHNANQITVPSSKGKYIYEVFAEWANGTVSYIFVIDIQ